MNDFTVISSEDVALFNKWKEQQTLANGEYQYLNLIKDIIDNGYSQDDRTKVGTLTKHGAMIRFDLRNNTIPLITTRKTFYRGAIEELLWLLRGETDVTSLQNKNIHIWDGNTTAEFISKRNLEGVVPVNSIGTLYGFQLRNWNGDWTQWRDNRKRTGIDQLKKLIDGIVADPEGRRHIISNYNVSQLNTGVLEPCHTIYGFNVDKKRNLLHSTLWMRSADIMCGVPLNFLHVSILTHILSKLLGYTAGDFVFMGNNVHLYKTHIENAKIQITRTPMKFPTLEITKDIKNIEDIENLEFSDFKVLDYQCESPLKYEMAI